MFKKMLIISLLSLSIFTFSNLTWATSVVSLDDTVWLIDGNFKTTINFPNYMSLTVTLPKLANFQQFGVSEIFFFDGNGDFEDTLLLLGGEQGLTVPLPTWNQKGLNFTVDITEIADAIAESLGDYVSGEPSKPPVFSGKIASNGLSISGKFTLNYKISIGAETESPINGTLSITFTFKGKPEPDSGSLSLSKAKNGMASRLPVIKNIISDIKSLIPRKGGLPKK